MFAPTKMSLSKKMETQKESDKYFESGDMVAKFHSNGITSQNIKQYVKYEPVKLHSSNHTTIVGVLTIVIVLLIMKTFMFDTSSPFKAAINSDDAAMLLCGIDCSNLMSIIKTVKFHGRITQDRDGKCCVHDTKTFVETLTKKFAETKVPVDTWMEKAGHWNKYEPFIANIKLQRQVYERGAVHLIGSYNTTAGTIKWHNEAAPSSLQLSVCSIKVKVSSTGNYFLYARIVFLGQTTSRLPYRLYQECPHGVAEIGLMTDGKRKDKDTVEYSTDRVVYLNKGDAIYVHISADERALISTEHAVHVLGLFEL